MKRSSIGLLLSIFSITVFCQHDYEIPPDSTYIFYWNSEARDWEMSSRYLFTCYPAGYDICKYHVTDGPENWAGDHRIYYAFNSNGDIIEELIFQWDDEKDDWAWSRPSKYNPDYNYDSDGKLTEEFVGDSYKYAYIYNSTGKLIEKALYNWNDETGEWRGTVRDGCGSCYDCSDLCSVFKYGPRIHNECCGYGRWVYNYDSFGNHIESIWYKWDDNSKQWTDPTTNVFKYDSAGNLINEIGFRHWHVDFLGPQVIKIRIDYKYDSSGNPTEKMLLYGDSESEDWSNDIRSIIEYDSRGNATKKISYDWDSEINDWVYSRKIISYWSEISTAKENKNIGQELIVFPNPANDLLTIETFYPGLHSVEIGSMNGQIFLSTEMEGTTQQFDLSSFQKGVYLITIRSQDFVTTRKIIKL